MSRRFSYLVDDFNIVCDVLEKSNNTNKVCILIHGFGACGKIYHSFANSILNYFDEIYMPTLRGHVPSTRLYETTHVDSIDDFTKDVSYLIDNVIDKEKDLYILGHSMGGVVASNVAFCL